MRRFIANMTRMQFTHTSREEVDCIFRVKCQAFAEEYDRPAPSISEAQLSLLRSKSSECWRTSYLHVVSHAAVCFGEALEHVGATRQEHFIGELGRLEKAHGVASVRGLLCCMLLPQPVRENEVRAMFAADRPTVASLCLYKLRPFFNHVVLARDCAIALDPDCMQIVVSRSVITHHALAKTSSRLYLCRGAYLGNSCVGMCSVYTHANTLDETHTVIFPNVIASKNRTNRATPSFCCE